MESQSDFQLDNENHQSRKSHIYFTGWVPFSTNTQQATVEIFPHTHIHTQFPGDIILVPLQNRKQCDEETPNEEVLLLELRPCKPYRQYKLTQLANTRAHHRL